MTCTVHTYIHTYIHTYMRWFSGNRRCASVTGDMKYTPLSWCVFIIWCPQKQCNNPTKKVSKKKKKEHNKYDFLLGTEDKIELSNNARGHPIACLCYPLDWLTSDFAIWGHPHFSNIPHLPETICVCVPQNHHTHTHTHTHTLGLSVNWGHGGQ